MDNITEFFKEFKSRLTNPLIVSFIISWLIVNWQVPVGVLGYKLDELKVDGYKSYSDLIEKNSSRWNYLWHPLIYAAIYTFLFPVVRMYIVAFLSYMKKKSDNWNTEIMKDYYVPMSRFVKQKAKYDELAAALNKIYTEDSQTVDENNALKKQVIQLNEEISAGKNKAPLISQEIEKMKNDEARYIAFNNISCIVGDWQLIRSIPNNPSNKETLKINIHDYNVTIITSLVGLPWGRIISYNYNSITREITLVLEYRGYDSSIDENRMNELLSVDVHFLKLGYRGKTDIFTDMEGVDIHNNKVIYSRPSNYRTPLSTI